MATIWDCQKSCDQELLSTIGRKSETFCVPVESEAQKVSDFRPFGRLFCVYAVLKCPFTMRKTAHSSQYGQVYFCSNLLSFDRGHMTTIWGSHSIKRPLAKATRMSATCWQHVAQIIGFLGVWALISAPRWQFPTWASTWTVPIVRRRHARDFRSPRDILHRCFNCQAQHSHIVVWQLMQSKLSRVTIDERIEEIVL